MSYETVEAGVSAVIQKLADYSSTNVTQADYSILADGPAKAVVLQRGPTPEPQPATLGATYQIRHEWVVDAEVYIHTKNRGRDEIEADTIAEAEAVIGELRKWPNLDGVSGVLFVKASMEVPVEDMAAAAASGVYWRQIVRVRVQEWQSVTKSE